LLAERIGKEISLRRRLMLLLLGPTEQEIEQVLRGRGVRRQYDGAGQDCGGNKRHAAAHGPIR
jgi:hypothetical protein